MPFRSSRPRNRRRFINILAALLMVVGIDAWSITGAVAQADRAIPFSRGVLADTIAITPAAARVAAPQNQIDVYLPLVAETTAPGRPVIANFSATPPTIAPGGASILAWSVSDATNLTMSPGVGSIAGSSIAVHAAARSEY